MRPGFSGASQTTNSRMDGPYTWSASTMRQDSPWKPQAPILIRPGLSTAACFCTPRKYPEQHADGSSACDAAMIRRRARWRGRLQQTGAGCERVSNHPLQEFASTTHTSRAVRVTARTIAAEVRKTGAAGHRQRRCILRAARGGVPEHGAQRSQRHVAATRIQALASQQSFDSAGLRTGAGNRSFGSWLAAMTIETKTQTLEMCQNPERQGSTTCWPLDLERSCFPDAVRLCLSDLRRHACCALRPWGSQFTKSTRSKLIYSHGHSESLTTR